MKKYVLVALAVIGGVIGLIVVLGLLYLGPILKKGVEAVGPMVARVPVTLDAANLNLVGGLGSLRGLVVGNPPGYSAGAAMKLGDVSLSVAPASLFSDKIHVRSISIRAPEIHLEGGLKENNLSVILANVRAFGGTSADQGQPASQKKLQMDSFVLRDARLSATFNVPGMPPLSLTLPDIELKDLGQGPEGITAGELTARVMEQVTSRVLAAVVENAGKAAAGAATGAAKDAVDRALKGAGGLLPPRN